MELVREEVVSEASVLARPRNSGIEPEVGETGDAGPDDEKAW